MERILFYDFLFLYFERGNVLFCNVAETTWRAGKWCIGSLVAQDKSVEKANPGGANCIH